MRGRFQHYGFCVHALCGGLLIMAVMAPPKTLHAGYGHGSDGSGRAAPLVEIAPLSPAWYIETIRRLLHAGRACESYQMARLAADRHSGLSMSGWLPPVLQRHPAVVSLPNATLHRSRVI